MPRIFIAIQFSHEVKATLLSLQDALRSKGVKGNYCPYGNLHMTLAFIGESDDLPAIRKAVGEVASPPFHHDPILPWLLPHQDRRHLVWSEREGASHSPCPSATLTSRRPRHPLRLHPLLSPHFPAPTPYKSALYRHQGSRDADNSRENKRDEVGED